jgi:hypothetical protein
MALEDDRLWLYDPLLSAVAAFDSDGAHSATEACDALRRELLGGWLRRDPELGHYDIPVPYIDGVTIADVHLEGTWPHTRVVVHLRDDQEDVEASGWGLPNPRPDPQGRVWT